MGKPRLFWLILCLTLFCVTQLSATHIVGGEFELQYLRQETYRLRLILYNDDIHGSPGAIDSYAQVHFWRKSDNTYLESANLPYHSRENVPYTNPACAIASLKTSKVIYASDIFLSADTYTDPEGYYVTYERCCRNHVISNIVDPGATGQTFYLEFPPVMLNGEEFVNSSPMLFPPLSDFARLGYPFFFDFRGTDPDGDSLVYYLVNPLAGYSNPDNPIPPSPMPRPYPEVRWQPGYSTSNMVPGTPSLRINKNGLLQLTPSQEGLFVFSVMAEEYRDGKKIGEVRRDFQMLVYNVAGEDFPPVLEAEKPSGEIFKDRVQIVDADFPTDAQDRCLTLKVRDQDILEEDDFRENLTFRIVPLNFSDASAIKLSVSSGSVTAANPELLLNMCLPQCPPVFNQPYRFLVVAYDDVCSVPLTDTLQVEVRLSHETNAPAQFYSLADNSPLRNGSHTFAAVEEGSEYDFFLEGFDDDGDELLLNWVPQDFDASRWGFSLEPVGEFIDDTGRRKVRYKVHWDARCTYARNFALQKEFTILFGLDDQLSCDQHKAARYRLTFVLNVPDNIAPTTLTSLNNYETLPDDVISINVPFARELTFDVRGKDSPFDYLRLYAVGKDFNLKDWGMWFESTPAMGQVQGTFHWNPSCAVVRPDGKHEFTLYFVTRDEYACKPSLSDTITVNLRVVFPENAAPVLSAHSRHATPEKGYFEVEVGRGLDILMQGLDANHSDRLHLRLVNVSPASAAGLFSWQDVSGSGGEVNSVLSLRPSCEMLQGASEQLLTFDFLLSDEPCYDPKAHSLRVEVLLKDRPQDFPAVKYVNVFSPNGDRCNPWFELRDLPEDGCYNRFEFIRIYNRWGALLFESNDRHFKWNAEGQPAGTYYYLLKYTDFAYRSPLALILGDPAVGDLDCNP